MTALDVVVVGAGAAGTTAAHLMAQRGLRVALVDRWATYPACFKAEKLEPDQSDLLRKFGLLDALLPRAAHIREVRGAEDGRVLRARPVEQFGLHYQDIVNQLRAALPASVDFRTDRVASIATSDDVQTVKLVGGDSLTARLVVIACGLRTDVLAPLGIHHRVIQSEQSLAFGFTIARPDGAPFPFDGVTYYPSRCAARVAYLTVFRVDRVMRANLWVYWPASDPRTRAFLADPRAETERLLPGVTRVLGDWFVVGRVETCRIDQYRAENVVQPGVVVLADSYQSSCPTTGLGLSRAFTDVDVLCNECLPAWLATPGMGAEKIAAFYANPVKRRLDDFALSETALNRELATNDALVWRARRARRRWSKRIARARDYFRLTRKLTA